MWRGYCGAPSDALKTPEVGFGTQGSDWKGGHDAPRRRCPEQQLIPFSFRFTGNGTCRLTEWPDLDGGPEPGHRPVL